jgi:hypothetical protein
VIVDTNCARTWQHVTVFLCREDGDHVSNMERKLFVSEGSLSVRR